MSNDAEEYRRWERLCLEQAELCQRPDARAAYLSLAPNYRIAAAEIEAQTVTPIGLWSKICRFVVQNFEKLSPKRLPPPRRSVRSDLAIS